MHSSGIPVWFFIGILLSVQGLLIFTYGLFELATGLDSAVQLSELHAPVWWGAMLALLGLFYVVRFFPQSMKKTAASSARIK